MFLAIVSYFIVLSDSSMPLFEHGSLNWRPGWIMIGAVLMLPLCFVDQKYLSFSSTLCILSNIYLVTFIIGLAISKYDDIDGAAVCYFGVTTGSVSMLSSL